MTDQLETKPNISRGNICVKKSRPSDCMGPAIATIFCLDLNHFAQRHFNWHFDSPRLVQRLLMFIRRIQGYTLVLHLGYSGAARMHNLPIRRAWLPVDLPPQNRR